MTHVLMFVPQYPYPVVGGLEKQSHELAKALVAAGVDVRVVSGRILPDQPPHEIVEGVPVTRIPWSNQKVIRFLRSPLDVARALWMQRRYFDVIHLHQHSWVGLYVILLARLLGKPILTKLPNVGELGLPGMRRQSLGWLRQAILFLSDALVAMSAESLAELKQAGYPLDRVLATPNGIELGEMFAHSQATVRNSTRCRVVFVGRLSEQKQLDVLLVAWSKVCAEGAHSAMLEIWGAGPLEHALKGQCEELGIAARVHFSGHVENAAAQLFGKDIFVLPSRAEGNSNAILEAMAAGLPIVSTPVGGTAMLVGEAGREFLLPIGDVQALSNCLLRLIADPGLRLATGSAMRDRVKQHFDIQDVAKTYARAYVHLSQGQRDRVSEASNPVVMGVG